MPREGSLVSSHTFLTCSISAIDDDFTAEFSTVSYWIDPPSDHFLIDATTGKIYLTAPVDYENKTKYEFMVSYQIYWWPLAAELSV